MLVKDLMSTDVVCCTRDTPLKDVAVLMVEADCGEIPVVDGHHTMKPVGVITDRDITCRAVALGKSPLEVKAGECMSAPAIAVSPADTTETCCQVMEDNQIRRILVVDDGGRCCGIVSQADIALRTSKTDTAQVVKEVSKKPSERRAGAPLARV